MQAQVYPPASRPVKRPRLAASGPAYDALGHRWDQVAFRGTRITPRITWVTDGCGTKEKMLLALASYTNPHGDVWHAAHFLSCDTPGKFRRVLVKPNGVAWLLIEEQLMGVCTRNKYARHLESMNLESMNLEASK